MRHVISVYVIWIICAIYTNILGLSLLFIHLRLDIVIEMTYDYMTECYFDVSSVSCISV